MASPQPPHIEAAFDHLRQALAAVGEGKVDLVSAPWADVERGVIKVLGGAFDEGRPEHQAVALGLSAVLAARLLETASAFWFPNREAPEGAMLGFTEALILLSPYSAVSDALGRGKLTQLDDTLAQIRQAIGQVKFSPQAAGAPPVRLTPVDYQRLFDPGFIQVVLLDQEKAKRTWDSPPDALARELREALGRVGEELPAQAKQQLEAQLVGTLSRMEPGKPIGAQAAAAPRLAEMVGHLMATAESTGAAPEEFWQDVVFPLGFIGAPKTFPPLDSEEKEAIQAGADLLALWVEAVPHQFPAAEEGLLGAFDPAEVTVPLPELARVGVPRLLQITPTQLRPALAAFSSDALREALTRFGQSVAEQAGGKAPNLAPDSEQMLEASLTLLEDLKRMVARVEPGKLVLAVRRITEAEAASELTLSVVRKALTGPRLILTAR